eukprot:COSAG05_NODE_2122_length_3528_cov_2.116360_2_plen_133_part_00
MVGILFSDHGTGLEPLQLQVCQHVFRELAHVAATALAIWERDNTSPETQLPTELPATGAVPADYASAEAFAFELVSILLALSGSRHGCDLVANKGAVLANLFTLLLVSSERVQRAVLAVIRRTILERYVTLL